MRKILIIAGILLCCLNMQAQDMKSLFVALPDSLSPLLTEVNRADFGDFLASNMKAQVKNRFGNTSEMLKLTDDNRICAPACQYDCYKGAERNQACWDG